VRKIKLHMLLLLFLIVVGCSASPDTDKNDVIDSGKEVSLSLEVPFSKTNYKLFMARHRELKLYEPRNGCYTGAYILSNPDVNFDIASFENITQTNHGIYLRNMKLGSVFPIEWVLECTSQMKTPFVILQPPSKDFPYQEYLLEDTAKGFGEYFIPIFVQFYPNPQQYKNPEEYKEFFKKARNIFEQYAPNVAFVWSVNAKNNKDSLLYYPGDEVVDWVGIDAYDLIYDGDIKNKKNIFEDIDFIYFLFQGKKPIMISQLGISHYTKKDHGYYIDEAAGKIKTFYKSIKNNYPMVKAINYMDFNNIETAPDGVGYDNFKITDQNILIEAYKEALKDAYFTDTVDIQSFGMDEKAWFVSYYPLYKRNEDFYICYEVIKYELDDENIIINEKNKIVIGETIYYSLKDIVADNGFKITTDLENKIIKLSKEGV